MLKLNKKENEIWKILLDAGYETYVVGGAVRDYQLGLSYSDVDFSTKATPNQIKQVFKNTKFKLDFVGESFGVMIISGIEVATFRGDRYFGNNDKDVEITYVDTIEEDLARRDFTINAMAMDIHGNLIDPFGGIDDINCGVIEFVGDPLERINEDPNRIFRAIRFATLFSFYFTAKTYVAIYENRKLINFVAPERIRIEILKVMKSSKNASRFWGMLSDFKILHKLFPELVDGIDHDHGNHHIEDVWKHNMIAGNRISTKYPLVKLAAYFHDIGKPLSYDRESKTFYDHQNCGADIVRKRLTNLKFHNDEIRKIVNLVLIHMDGTLYMSSKSRRKLKNKLFNYGIEWREYLRLRIADRAGNLARPNYTISEIKKYIRLFTMIEEVPMSVNDLAISGGEIIEIFNLTPSEIVGKIQRELLKQVINKGDEFNNREELVKHATEVFFG